MSQNSTPWSPLPPYCPFLLPTDKEGSNHRVLAVPCLQKACPHPSGEGKLALGPTFKKEEWTEAERESPCPPKLYLAQSQQQRACPF